MTETTKRIFQQYEVRKTKKQKTAFIEFLTENAQNLGYESRIEKGMFARNVVIGDPDTAKVVYTAHYDTCARLPFPNFITPTCFPLYLAYQLLLTVLILLPVVVVMGLVFGLVALLAVYADILIPDIIVMLLYWLILIVDMYLFMAGPANPHTANDNTSGVITLLDIMATLPAYDRDNVAFVFFDLEEAGLVGSSNFAKKHKKAMKNKLLVNFDCVSDGETMLFALKSKARPYEEVLEQAFSSTSQVSTLIKSRGVVYPSDQRNFPIGVGVAALRTGRFGIPYLSRIHTKKDTIYRQENIDFLTQGAVKLVRLMDN